MKTEVIKVQNIHCAGCVRNIETALSQLDGVVSVKANLDDKTVTVQYNDNGKLSALIRETLEEWGYPEEK